MSLWMTQQRCCHSFHDRLIIWKKMESSWPHLSINGHNCLHKSVQHCCSANQEHYHTSYTKCPIQTYIHSHTEPGVRTPAFRLVDDPLRVLAEPRLIHKTVSSGRQLQWVFPDQLIRKTLISSLVPLWFVNNRWYLLNELILSHYFMFIP